MGLLCYVVDMFAIIPQIFVKTAPLWITLSTVFFGAMGLLSAANKSQKITKNQSFLHYNPTHFQPSTDKESP